MLQLLPVCAFGGSSVINMSRYDVMCPNFSAMKDERIVGMIHEAIYPRYERDAKFTSGRWPLRKSGSEQRSRPRH